MSEASVAAPAPARPSLDRKAHPAGSIAFLLVLLSGLAFAAWSIFHDTASVGEPLAIGAFAFLGLALLIALAFEFVNGFHDTANAVATVIYTHSLPPLVAVVWSGLFNFIGVMVSAGTVAYSIVTLLPVELILNVGSAAGYAMIFSLLLAAIIWNLGTWAFGIPNSSSHALIGSIMGVGLANQLMAPAGQATSGVDWNQAVNIGTALLFSPIVGFICSMLLLWLMKVVIRSRKLYTEPQDNNPPPAWIRGLLVLTCTGVSFAHGNNDGQKGMGLIMLILIGVAPTAYALNRTMDDSATPAFEKTVAAGQQVFLAHAGHTPVVTVDAARSTIGSALKTKKLNDPAVFAAISAVSGNIAAEVRNYGAIQKVPAAATPNLRNDMYLVAAATGGLNKAKALSGDDAKAATALQKSMEAGTRFIPGWVKIAVALALGLGTMVGWKRIVVTVGEKIGKTHLTYGQGAAAELVAATTILGAVFYGMPVSTTHILSSGVAGTMAANGSGLQWSTVRNIILSWVLTLPAAIALAAGLYWAARQFIH
jgi:PiT family inorganic phosphate transporter